MTLTSQKTTQQAELEKLIAQAIKKVGGTKENDLCKYIPGPTGGYMHHFTLRKIKNSDPDQLIDLIQSCVIDVKHPIALDPKPRAPRGSRKRRDFVSFTRTDIEKVLDLARQVGDSDLLARFSPKRSLPSLKRELIRSIRENRVNHELWNGYAEAISMLMGSETGDI